MRNKLKSFRIAGFSILTLVALIVSGLISWALFSLLNQSSSDLLLNIGVSNFYLQYIIVIVFGVIALFLLGYSSNKVVKSIIG